MLYRWGEYSLDRTGSLLKRQGQPVDASRKVLDCINHLITHHERVVGYDELIHIVWRHENVSNHQLAQVILAARRAIGDDGQAQKLIRTVSGVGYQWVGALNEITDTSAAPQALAVDVPLPAQVSAAAPEISPPPQVHAAPPTASVEVTAWYRNRTLRLALALTLTLLAVAFSAWKPRKTELAATTASPVAATIATPLARLEEALWRGKYEEVREGLANLPAHVTDSRDARVLEIRLDIARGRFDRAMEKLALQQVRAKDAADPVWQAQLFALQAVLSGSAGKPGPEVLAPAQSAVKLLESAGNAASPKAMGEALSARGYGFMKTQQLEPAMRDLVRARDLLLMAGDKRGAADAADTLARIHMRMGRFSEALELMDEIAKYSEKSKNPIQEIYARNATTKIQIELLRWSDALASSDRCMQLLKTVPDSERRTRVYQLRALVLTGMGRLREASSLIEEADAMHDPRYSSITTATYHLASGNAEQALATASEAEAFDRYNVNDDLNLESKEGALLLWMIAAQDLVAKGSTMPMPSPTQLHALRKPESIIGHIALGRWLWSQGKSQDAEAEFRKALSQTRLMGHPARMLKASEALIELLLQRGDTAAAEQALAEVRGYDPERLSHDYRTNLLELRVALTSKSEARIRAAYQNAQALAGERTLPMDLVKAYKQRTSQSADHSERRGGDELTTPGIDKIGRI